MFFLAFPARACFERGCSIITISEMSRFSSLIKVSTSLVAFSALWQGLVASPVLITDLWEEPVKEVMPEGMDYKVQGSIVSLDMLASGEAEIALIPIPDGREFPQGMVCIPVAFDVVSILVNESNPLEKISLPELARVYSSRSDGAVKWGDLGLTGIWEERTINACVLDSSEWMAMQLFRNYTVQDGLMRDGLITLSARKVLEQTVGEQSTSIVIMRGIDIPAGGRALAISRDNGADSFSYQPTESSIYFGDYAMRLPFYVVMKADADESTRKVAELLLSDAMADELAKFGYIPAPKTERDLSLYLQ